MRKYIIILLLIAVTLSLFAIIEDKKPTVWRERCVGCGDCAQQCPVKAITVNDGKAVIDAEKCVNCKICVITCQYRAVR